MSIYSFSIGYAYAYEPQDFPTAQMVKNLPATQEIQVQFLAQEDPLEKGMAEWQPTTVFLPGEFHRQRSLEGYIP